MKSCCIFYTGGRSIERVNDSSTKVELKFMGETLNPFSFKKVLIPYEILDLLGLGEHRSEV